VKAAPGQYDHLGEHRPIEKKPEIILGVGSKVGNIHLQAVNIFRIFNCSR
jgi:hypothetical protein